MPGDEHSYLDFVPDGRHLKPGFDQIDANDIIGREAKNRDDMSFTKTCGMAEGPRNRVVHIVSKTLQKSGIATTETPEEADIGRFTLPCNDAAISIIVQDDGVVRTTALGMVLTAEIAGMLKTLFGRLEEIGVREYVRIDATIAAHLGFGMRDGKRKRTKAAKPNPVELTPRPAKKQKVELRPRRAVYGMAHSAADWLRELTVLTKADELDLRSAFAEEHYAIEIAEGREAEEQDRRVHEEQLAEQLAARDNDHDAVELVKETRRKGSGFARNDQRSDRKERPFVTPYGYSRDEMRDDDRRKSMQAQIKKELDSD